MKKTANKKIITCIAISFVALAVVISGLLFYQDYKGPDMGPKLEYVGKQTLASECFFFCRSQETTDYYYATDMTEKEIIEYFGKLKYLSSSEFIPGSEGTNRSIRIGLKDGSENYVGLDYFYDQKMVAEIVGLRSSSRKFLIAVYGDREDKDLRIFQNALR
jgi:hypothetical protein